MRVPAVDVARRARGAALSAGWSARATGWSTSSAADSVEHGWIAFLQMFRALMSGDFADRPRRAEEAVAVAASTTPT